MTHEEVKTYFKEIVSQLWPKWELNNAQILEWAKSLKGFDYSAIRRATQEHYTTKEGQYGKPKLPEIIEKARVYQPRSKPADKPAEDDYEPDVFIQCVEHETKPSYVCWYQAVYVEKRHRDEHDYVVQAGVELCKRFEACYGGQWIVVQHTSQSEMDKQFLEHRGIDISKLLRNIKDPVEYCSSILAGT